MPNLSNATEIRPYTSKNHIAWDTFVSHAKNGHFLFMRDYMEYHADRFDDASLMFYWNDTLVGLLPANSAQSTMWSHQGLTYGGLITSERMSAALMMNLFSELVSYLRSLGYWRLIYKAMPHIHHRLPAEEDLYALTCLGGQLSRRDLSSVIDLTVCRHLTKGKKNNLAKAKKAGIHYKSSNNFEDFMDLLRQVLYQRHRAAPAHNGRELSQLADKFPKQIRLFEARAQNSLLAGAIIYDTGYVAHTQYLANSEVGREFGALDGLIEYLISTEYKNRRYFSFGISTEDEGRTLNTGLAESKEAFGARSIVHDWYHLELRA